ncbi:hypothetical protein [Legionella birminghamensis]|uniref:hypothetical protein n=1 Tax=Legionella birminghamensis TaxID=28083 RepID=UPI000AF2F2FB|nr:hypothetical protein [Legionella birminghamensis]
MKVDSSAHTVCFQSEKETRLGLVDKSTVAAQQATPKKPKKTKRFAKSKKAK